MKLKSVAGFFDRIPVYDWFTKDFLFYGQLNKFGNATRENTTNNRRILSFQGTTNSEILDIDGQPYILGSIHDDVFPSSQIRRQAIVLRGDSHLLVMNPIDVLDNAANNTNVSQAQSLGSLSYLKNWIDQNITAIPRLYFDLYTPKTLAATKRQFFNVNGALYYIVANYVDEGTGFLVNQVVQLRKGYLKTLTLSRFDNQYNPVTMTYVPAVDLPIKAIVVDFKDCYEYVRAGDPLFLQGDLGMFIRASDAASAKPGMLLTDASGPTQKLYTVITVNPLDDGSLYLHVRYAEW